jgi:hypothetical protein
VAGAHVTAFLALVAALVFASAWRGEAHAATRGELDQTLDDLVRLLPGEYSSAPLVRLEEASGVSPENRHASLYWVLARVEVPHAGRNVFLQQVRRGGNEGEVLVAQQRLLALRVDPARDGIVVELRPLLAPEETVDAHRNTERQRLLLFDPQGKLECDWLWRRRGADLAATLVAHGSELPCAGEIQRDGDVAGGEWVLSEEELAVRDAQSAPASASDAPIAARATWQRLFRARTFGCSWLSAAAAPAPSTAFFELHDRGGEYRIDSATGGGLILRLMRGPMPTERLRGQRDVTGLAVISASSDRVHAESRASGAADYLTLRFADQLIECARR